MIRTSRYLRAGMCLVLALQLALPGGVWAAAGKRDLQVETMLVYAGLPMPMFEEAVKRLRINVDKLVLWLDTCHAGAVSVAARGVTGIFWLGLVCLQTPPLLAQDPGLPRDQLALR